MEKTLVLIKPDAIQRGLVGEVISRFENKGLKLLGIKMMKLSDVLLREHYVHIADKPFFSGISRFMQSSPVVAMVWEGVDAILTVRKICGTTKAREADMGTIRGDLAMSIQCNIVHASEDANAAKIEVARFFNFDEMFEYDKSEYIHVYSEDELKK